MRSIKPHMCPIRQDLFDSFAYHNHMQQRIQSGFSFYPGKPSSRRVLMCHRDGPLEPQLLRKNQTRLTHMDDQIRRQRHQR
jgi:hypothetical protein